MNWSKASAILEDHPWVKVSMHTAFNTETDRPGFETLDLCLRYWFKKSVAYIAIRPWTSQLLQLKGAKLEFDLKHASDHLEIHYDVGIYVIYGPEKPNDYWKWEFLHSNVDSVETIIRQVLEKRPNAEIKGVVVQKTLDSLAYAEAYNVYPVPEGWDPKSL
jgi:hypothetical protein